MTPLRPSTPSPTVPLSPLQTNTAPFSFRPQAVLAKPPRGRSKSTSMANAAQELSRRISYPISIRLEGQAERDDSTWGIRPDTPLSFPASVTPTGGSPGRGHAGARGRAMFEVYGRSEEDDTGEVGGVEEDLWANARYAEANPRPSRDAYDDEEDDPFRASPISTHFSIPPSPRPMARSLPLSPAPVLAPGATLSGSPRPLRRSRPSLPTILSTYSEATTELSSRHGQRLSSRFSAFSDAEDDNTTEGGHAPHAYQYQYRSTYTQRVERPPSPDDTLCSPRPTSGISYALPSPITTYAPVTFAHRSGPRPRSQTWAAPRPVLDLHIATDSPTLPSFEWGRVTRQSVCSAYEAAGGEHWSPPPSPGRTVTPSPTLEAVTIEEGGSEGWGQSGRQCASGGEVGWVPFPRSRPVSGLELPLPQVEPGRGTEVAKGLGVLSPPSSPGWLSQRAAARPRPARVAGGLGGQPWLLAPVPLGKRSRPITAIAEEVGRQAHEGAQGERERQGRREASPGSLQRYSSSSSMLLFDRLARRVMNAPVDSDRREVVLANTPLAAVQSWQRHVEPPFALPSGLICPVPVGSPNTLAFPSQSDVQDFETAASQLSSRASSASSGSSATAGDGYGEGEGDRTVDFSEGQGDSAGTTATSWGSRDSWVVFPRVKGRRSV